MRLRVFCLMTFASAYVSIAGDVMVTAVTAQQRYPWNGLVDITVVLNGTAEDLLDYQCVFTATNRATQAALSVSHIEKKGEDVGSGTTWTRRFVWNAMADVGAVKVGEVLLTADVKEFSGVQLWENGPYWAKCNVGATKPEECGYYFWWGDTIGYIRNAANDGWASVDDGSRFVFSSATANCPTGFKNNLTLQSLGYINETGNLAAKYDAATAYLGKPWRMPTDTEFAALIDNCTTTWTIRDGVYGCLVSGKGSYSSKSIFLPAAGSGSGSKKDESYGMYWSSTPDSDTSEHSMRFYFNSYRFRIGDSVRYCGMPVRPLR